MSKHVSEWLNAYHDGELHGHRRRMVEEHLAECETCQAELDSLQGLSDLLHEVRTPDLASPERFVSNVNLRLPHARTVVSQKPSMGFGWWLIPVGLLTTWVFINTAFIVSNILAAASGFGLLGDMTAWLALGPTNELPLSSTVGQMGFMNGNGLGMAQAFESYLRTSVPHITLQVSIALLYLGWMAIWWARHTRQVHGQLLEG